MIMIDGEGFYMKKYILFSCTLVLIVFLCAFICDSEAKIADDKEESFSNSSSSKLLQPADLEYLGAFRLPDTPGEVGWEWSGYGDAAMTYYPQGDPNGPSDGYPGSIFATGNDQFKYISEITIPAPVVSTEKNVEALNTANTLQDFSDVLGSLISGLEMPIVGLQYLPKQGEQKSDKLYYCFGQHFQEGMKKPSHGWVDLDLSNPQIAGPWIIDDKLNYVTNDYIFSIPREWADTNTPGMYLATGRFREGGQGAMGPSIIAYSTLDEGNLPKPGTKIPAVPLLLYTSVASPEQHILNGYNHSDEWVGGAWLTSEDKSAVIFVGTKGKKECWYGFADGTVWPDYPPYPPVPQPQNLFIGDDERSWWSSEFETEIIFYDPAELAEVAKGNKKTYQPQPYAKLNIDKYLYHIKNSQQKNRVGAVAFDRERGFLYILEPLADGDKPLIHVWRLK